MPDLAVLVLVVAAAFNPTVVSIAYLVGAAVLLLRPTSLRSPLALEPPDPTRPKLGGRTHLERLQRLRSTYGWLAAAAAAILLFQYAVLLASQPPYTLPSPPQVSPPRTATCPDTLHSTSDSHTQTV